MVKRICLWGEGLRMGREGLEPATCHPKLFYTVYYCEYMFLIKNIKN